MLKQMTNAEIYGLNNALSTAFNSEERYLPAKINFYIQRNKNILAQLNESIESTRMDIIKRYGTPVEDDEQSYDFSKENLRLANNELSDLLNIVQDVSIVMVHLSDLAELEFTPKQMQALLFMIEED